MSSIFDDITASPLPPANSLDNAAPAGIPNSALPQTYTAQATKAATQELLKFGLLEADQKPNLYQTAQIHTDAINQILEPLDLRLKIDDIRGLAFLVVAETFRTNDDDDEWSHPLIRRQRLTLEQSLMLAILRQHYVVHEQEAGIGAGGAIISLDDLLPSLKLYLGESGSDAKDQKQLRNLLENLKAHGIVSDIDDKDKITIRPIITHVATPQTLQALLQQLKSLAQSEHSTDNRSEVSP